jgi:hypothetical protein
LNLSGTIAAHDVFVIANGQTTGTGSSPACSPALQALADQLDGIYPSPTYMNGNDAIVLYKGATIVDILGKTGDAAMTTSSGWSDLAPYDGSAGTIWTENHTLKRKATVTQGITTNPTPEFIVTAEWDSLSVNTWTGLGTHTCTCATGINEIDNSVSVVLYPNPSNTGVFNVTTSEVINTIEVFNTLGQRVISEAGNKNKSMSIETTSLPKGVYVVKLAFDKNKSSVVKLSIQ